MANTFTQIYIHIVLSVQGRLNLISKNHKEELQKYTSGIISGKDQRLLAINCMSDHTHILVGLRPDKSLSDLVRDIKSNSSAFINRKKWVAGKFNWQEGYGAFSYSHSQLTSVMNYIQNQERHHTKRAFREEYLEMLKKFDIAYDKRYVFKWIESE